MRKINLIEPSSNKWKEWKKKCDNETQRVIKNVNVKKSWIKKPLYKEQKKEFYFKNDKPFYRKCAYCESELSDYDDLDHYRPARGIADMNHKKINHPGYYWLTYKWKNLLPACKTCNSKIKKNGEITGKGNRFPVKGFRAKKPGEEKDEEPLLINPILEDPANHFEFREDIFKIVYKGNSKKGKVTYKILGFHKREELWLKWENAYRNVNIEYGRTYGQEDLEKGGKMRKSLYKMIKSGECKFSYVKLQAIEQIFRENNSLQSEVCIE